MSRMSGNAERLLLILAGAGLGAGVALLFAPKTGRDTRRAISRAARHSRDRVVETSEEFVDRGKRVFEHGKTVVDEAMEYVDRGRRAVLG
jgi:gas vesicle protein